MDTIYRLSACEGVFAPCFDQLLNKTERYTATGCTCTQTWDSVSINSAETCFSVSWSGEVHTGSYDTLMACISAGDHIAITIRAVVNGQEQLVCKNISGGNFPIEPCGAVARQAVISRVCLEFRVLRSVAETNFISLRWLGLSDSSRLAEVENLPHYDETSWDSYIRDDICYDSGYRLMFGENELARIQTRLTSERMGGIATQIIETAHKHEHDEPEAEIREFIPVDEHLYRYVRVRDRGRRSLPFISMAIAGYLTQNRSWSRMAARMIMCAVKTPHWFEGPQCCMEGSTWHHVCFTEQAMVCNMVVALSFLGDIFTDKAMEEIKVAIEKNYRCVVQCCEEKGYRRFSNQGIVENAGRLIGACGLYALGGEQYLIEAKTAYEALSLLMSDYIDPDGYCYEGPGYYLYSVSSALNAWKVYAQVFHKDIREVIPDNVKQSKRYLDCIMSSIGDCGNVISLNSGGAGPLGDGILSFFTTVMDWERGQHYTHARMQSETALNSEDLVADLLLMCYLPDAVTLPELPEEQYRIFEKRGLASYEWANGKFWFFAEGNPRTGHYHRDRGSIMLECFGEKVLADPGITNYGNIISTYMPLPDYHNLAHPAHIPMVVQNPIANISANEAGVGCSTIVTMADFEKPAARVQYISRTAQGLAFAAHLEELYDERVLTAERKGTFNQNEDIVAFSLEDVWELREEQELLLNFMAYAPWQIEDNRASMKIGHALLTLSFESDGVFSLTTDDGMKDYCLTQLYRLKLTSASARQHRIVTKATVERCLS